MWANTKTASAGHGVSNNENLAGWGKHYKNAGLAISTCDGHDNYYFLLTLSKR